MRFWIDEISGCKMCEPDCADEWLEMIWAVGVDYDGCSSVQGLQELVDELVEMSQKARECLQNGQIFPDKVQCCKRGANIANEKTPENL